MFNFSISTLSHFFTFIGLAVLYGGVSYAWSHLESIETLKVEIELVEYELTLVQEIYDEYEEALEDNLLYSLAIKDDELWKMIIGIEIYEEEYDEGVIQNKLRVLLEENPIISAQILSDNKKPETLEFYEPTLKNIKLKERKIALAI